MQKAAKSLASRNTFILRRNHLITVALHLLFLLFQILLVHRRSWPFYLTFCGPAIAIEIYLDVIGRPEYSHDGFLRRPGQDLDAQGLTEYMWDVVYWTWINIPLVLLFGNNAWWLYLVVPAYTIYLAVTTVGGLKAMLSPPQDDGDATTTGSESKRQQKLGKRAQQRMAYQNQY
jgi:SRP-independent targeting protein 2/TMEM208